MGLTICCNVSTFKYTLLISKKAFSNLALMIELDLSFNKENSILNSCLETRARVYYLMGWFIIFRDWNGIEGKESLIKKVWNKIILVATLGPVNWVVGKHNKLLDTQTCHNRQTWRVCCSWFLHVKSKLRIKFAYLVFIIFGCW